MDTTYFDERTPNLKTFSLPVFVNQAGYKTNGIKRAVLKECASQFSLVDSDTSVTMYRGTCTHFGVDACSQDDIYIADFSDFAVPGTYYLVTDTGVKSLPFPIADTVFDSVLYDTMKAFYFLRCGMDLEEKYAGKFGHPACHTAKAVLWEEYEASINASCDCPCTPDDVSSNTLTTYDITGGWHDAGDYGRYITAGACALAHLLFAYKMYPEKLKDLHLNIPESSTSASDNLSSGDTTDNRSCRLPDFLAECKYELLWFLKMQREDGGVYHKATTLRHAPFIMPEEDTDTMLILPVSSMATADFAAICAMASGIYREFDVAFADTLLAAAEKSGDWLEKNPEFLGFKNPEGCNTGEYGEHDDKDNRFWAYTELYIATGKEFYHERMKSLLKMKFPLTGLGFAAVGGFGTLSYLLCDREGASAELKDFFKECFLDEALRLKELSDSCGYGAAMAEEDYVWGSNMNLMKHGMIFAIADYLTGTDTYLSYATLQADYLLGVNATGYSYVTGTGAFCCNYPHLRPAHADGIEECIPGMVSGGPNRHPADVDAKILIPEGTPPMKCFADDVGCYSLNEITIYWNSPAVFVLAYLK